MNKIKEFWYNVSSQDDLPLYKGHTINSKVCDNLILLIDYYRNEVKSSNSTEDILKTALLHNPDIIKDLRLLLGISDKRLYLDLTYLSHFKTLPNNARLDDNVRGNLVKHSTAFYINKMKKGKKKLDYVNLVVEYFIAKGIEEILIAFSSLNNKTITTIFNNLIAPKEIQQKQAKYRGHGAEMTFAKTFVECGVNIFPSNKHIDPMAGYDPNVDLKTMSIVDKDTSNPDIHSFDLIIKDKNGDIKILVQSLIHSSDPGQFGVDKSNETVTIKEKIERYNTLNPNKTVYLMGSVDGVGFSENPNGTIIKMLEVFDEFFQMNTLFKIGIFLKKIGLINNLEAVKLDSNYFDQAGISHFENKYLVPNNIALITNQNTSSYETVSAGKGYLLFKTK